MPKPLLSAEAIFDEALRILAEEGAAGLTIRTLAARLRCSNKTLYQQVGSYEVLVRGVVARAFARLELGFAADAVWEVAAESWCTELRAALLANPDLCTLMTIADRDVVIDHVHRLMTVLERDGFSHSRAVEAGGILAHVTLSMTLSDVAAPGEWDDPRVFATTVRWLVHGMALSRAEENLRHHDRAESPRTGRTGPRRRKNAS
ncbi:TetR/AcrR family transcriptional regulator [Nocardia sp. BMG111209]|uniref:TetR/AcrR family transcriptional regulator n=1 Tax=Nocardia sp. BMG111209 TaxID=1160137 RepID=UPI000379F7C7|nr:TetR/AcrR family transcriptional regulator C-terminal domain-containing protein [Nocardia sp. BMG111209]